MKTLSSKLMVLITMVALLISIAPLAMAQDSDTATVTVIHNIETVPPVDVYANEIANGTAVINALEFEGETTLDVPAGDYTFFVTPAGALSPILIEAEFSLEAGESYTIEATLDADGNPTLAPVVTLPTILEIATSNEDFSTLVVAVETAGEPITDVLSSEGPITVFAPTNAAFDALPEGTLEAVLGSEPSLLGVLGAHVVEGNITLADLTDGATFQTAGMFPFELVVSVNEDGEIFINDTVKVAGVEVAASNGNVIVIEGVIVPERPGGAPDADATEMPDMDATEMPDMDATEMPDMDATDTPDMDATEMPDMDATDTPDMDATEMPDMDATEMPDMDATEAPEMDADMDSGDAELGNIREVADGAGNLGFLGTAVDTFGVDALLTQEGPITVFAPSDDAFNANLTVLLELANSPQVGIATLRYHMVEGIVTSEDVIALAEEGGSLETLAGESITFELVDGNVVINGRATIEQVDLMASNGVIHVLDNVLFLPEEGDDAEETGDADAEGEEPTESILDIAAGNEDFSTLVLAVETAGEPITDVLSSEGPITVFAPTNEAFETLPEGLLETVLESEPSLIGILSAHVVEGNITLEDLVDGATFQTAGMFPFELVITVNEDGEIFINDTVKVAGVEVAATNGNIIVIEGVIVPERPGGAPDADATEMPEMDATEAPAE